MQFGRLGVDQRRGETGVGRSGDARRRILDQFRRFLLEFPPVAHLSPRPGEFGDDGEGRGYVHVEQSLSGRNDRLSLEVIAFLRSQDDQLTWKEETFHGEWAPGSTAGGSGQPNKGFASRSISSRSSFFSRRKILDESSVFGSAEFHRRRRRGKSLHDDHRADAERNASTAFARLRSGRLHSVSCLQSNASVQKKRRAVARDGDRTHAHDCELDLKSNALTTRPPWRISLFRFSASRSKTASTCKRISSKVD